MATFYTGNTGRSTGPHLDMRVYNPATGQYEDPSGYTSYLSQDGKPFDYQVTSGYGMRDHPVTGGRKMHHGIDYATPTGTALAIDGSHMSTWNDAGGGIMSQYLISTDDGHRELLLLHGSDQNKITGKGAITSYKPEDFSTFTPPETPQVADGTPTASNTELDLPTDSGAVPEGALLSRSGGKAKAQAYADMSKTEMNAAYDTMRKDQTPQKLQSKVRKCTVLSLVSNYG